MVFESQRYLSRQIDPAPVIVLLIVVLTSRTDTGLVTELDRGNRKINGGTAAQKLSPWGDVHVQRTLRTLKNDGGKRTAVSQSPGCVALHHILKQGLLNKPLSEYIKPRSRIFNALKKALERIQVRWVDGYLTLCLIPCPTPDTYLTPI